MDSNSTILDKFSDQIFYAFSSHADGNMSFKFGNLENVNENRRKWITKIGVDQDNIYKIFPMPEMGVVVIDEEAKENLKGHFFDPEIGFTANGCVTQLPNTYIFIHLGDSLPILFYEPTHKFIGLARSGWRETENQMVALTVQALAKNYKINLEKLVVLIGPAIHKCCFKFKDPAQSRWPNWNKYLQLVKKDTYAIDLVQYNIDQLVEVGVKLENIEDMNYCTSCHRNQIFSHYADHDKEIGEGRFGVIFGLK